MSSDMSYVSHGDLLKAIVLIAFAASSMALSAFLFLKPPLPPKSFSYAENMSGDGQSVEISNVNGGVVATPWTGNQVRINGTVVARGPDARPEQVSLEESNSGGKLVFRPVFPTAASRQAGASYVVTVSVFFPSSVTFSSFDVSTLAANIDVTGLNAVHAGFEACCFSSSFSHGSIRLSSLNATRVVVYADQVDVSADLSNIQSQGFYSFSLSNHGSLDLKLPRSGGFTLGSRIEGNSGGCGGTTGCMIQPSGFGQCQVSGPGYSDYGIQMLNATCGDGSASIDLSVGVGNVIITRSS